MMWIIALHPKIWLYHIARASDVGRDTFNGINHPCGWNRENVSTSLSTENALEAENPYLGRIEGPRPYMGVSKIQLVRQLLYFSTPEGTYPQIIASYPQFTCLGDNSCSP